MRTRFVFGVFLAAFAARAVAFAVELPVPPQIPSEQPVADSAPGTDDTALTGGRNQRLTVDVLIGGKGPFPFIVDTGAENTVITRELADQLELRDGPQRVLHSVGAKRTVRTAVIPHLAVNRVVARNITVSSVARRYLDADGILGLATLKSQRMLMDFKTGSMMLTPSSERQEPWEGESITVTARSRLGQLILADASIEDDHVQVILDTGNDVSVGNEALRRLLAKRRATRSDANGWLWLLDVNGNTTQFDYQVVNQLRIATIGLNNIPVGFADAHVFDVLGLKHQPALLLGMDVLRLFGRVSIDFGNRRVRFQRPEAYEPPAQTSAVASPVVAN